MSQSNRRRTLWRVLGIVAIIVGVVAGLVLWAVADQRLADAVDGMARAPIGCDTVLDFDESGTYLLFVETEGELDDVRGDCDADTDIDWTDDDLPAVTLTLVDPEGSEVTLDADEGVSYDTFDAAGESIRSVDIESPGDHVLRVESDDSGFVIAVGHDPNDGVIVLRGAAIAALVLGVVVGIVLLASSRRRRAGEPASSESWTPQAVGPDWPMSPPGFPAPPPTTGTTAVVGPPTGPVVTPSAGPLPTPPASPPSVAPIPGQPGPWGPPPPPAGKRPGT